MRLRTSGGRARRTVLASAAALATAGMLAVAAPAQAGQQADPAERSNPGSRVIGGSQVPDGKYPFMAALLFKGKGSAVDRQFCGASLYSPYVVMTAAHCVDGMDPKDLEIAIGRTVLSNTKQGVLRKAAPSEGEFSSILVHPRYNPAKNFAYDIALILLDKRVSTVTPVTLPTPGTDALIRPGQKATVTGWGNIDTAQPTFPDRLREVRKPLLSHDECRISYPGYNPTSHLCAGVEGKDSCQGDSGGPLFRTVRGREAPYQIGIVSWGHGCAGQGAPGVYTNLSSKKLWDTIYDAPNGKRFKKALAR
ncbi:S1 family serine peptidase [Streptomyces sp. NPDC057638]|uniref:S1 family serine peptidase n=1 Tax=Streptomyces sp. NPDC057638 TaxID=3346190 RepID=UPI00369E683F